MCTFALRRIEAVKGRQRFDKLIVDGVCHLDRFEEDLEECYRSELYGLYATMNEVANLRSVPHTKFHFYDDAKGLYREFEFKTKHLRVYGTTVPGGKVIITGGTKVKQKSDQSKFRRLKNLYIKSLK